MNKIPATTQAPNNAPTPSLVATDDEHNEVVQAMLSQTELYVNQPCPSPCAPQEQTPDWSMYPIYDIDPNAYSLLEQCDHLQIRLEGDTLILASRCSPFTVDACRNVREKLTVLLDLSECILKSKIKALQILLDLAEAMFKHLAANSGSSDNPGTLPVAILDMLSDDLLTLPATAAPVEAYAQVARRWATLEQAIAAETLKKLSLKLQVMRLGFYQSAGQYLARQAAVILRDDLVDEEWVMQGDIHPGRAVLESCAAEPFLSRWPQGAKSRTPISKATGANNDE